MQAGAPHADLGHRTSGPRTQHSGPSMGARVLSESLRPLMTTTRRSATPTATVDGPGDPGGRVAPVVGVFRFAVAAQVGERIIRPVHETAFLGERLHDTSNVAFRRYWSAEMRQHCARFTTWSQGLLVHVVLVTMTGAPVIPLGVAHLQPLVHRVGLACGRLCWSRGEDNIAGVSAAPTGYCEFACWDAPRGPFWRAPKNEEWAR